MKKGSFLFILSFTYFFFLFCGLVLRLDELLHAERHVSLNDLLAVEGADPAHLALCGVDLLIGVLEILCALVVERLEGHALALLLVALIVALVIFVEVLLNLGDNVAHVGLGGLDGHDGLRHLECLHCLDRLDRLLSGATAGLLLSRLGPRCLARASRALDLSLAGVLRVRLEIGDSGDHVLLCRLHLAEGVEVAAELEIAEAERGERLLVLCADARIERLHSGLELHVRRVGVPRLAGLLDLLGTVGVELGALAALLGRRGSLCGCGSRGAAHLGEGLREAGGLLLDALHAALVDFLTEGIHLGLEAGEQLGVDGDRHLGLGA